MDRLLVILGFSALTAACFGAAGCGGEGSSESCTASAPASCPSTPPSYAADVAPLLETYCVSCHQAGGSEADKPLNTYQGAAAMSGEVKHEVAGCYMPPPGAAQPTDAERETILAWLVCGAQNN